MGKPGAKPKGKVKIEWSPDFAYAIGLIVTDGCLYADGRHVNFTSKDSEMITNFLHALRIDMHVGRKGNGANKEKKYYVVQFGDVLFCDFLKSIGITSNKTKTIGPILVPWKYFRDFLRGHLDGDGSVYSYFDPRWRSSFMFYTGFVSASRRHVDWLQERVSEHLGIYGHITSSKDKSYYQLKYAKKDSIKIFKFIYYKKDVTCLSRKRLKIEKILAILRESKRQGRSPWT